MTGKMIRSITLVVTIITGAAFCGILWIGYFQMPLMIVPAVAFTVIYVWVLAAEVWGATTGVRKTLSTRYKYWAAKEPFLAWSALILFWFAMTSLVFHLGVFW